MANCHRIKIRSIWDNASTGGIVVEMDGRPVIPTDVSVVLSADEGLNKVTLTFDGAVDVDIPADVTVIDKRRLICTGACSSRETVGMSWSESLDFVAEKMREAEAKS